MSCLRIFDVTDNITIIGDGGEVEITVLPGFTHEDLYKNTTVSSMLMDLEAYKKEGKLDYALTMHVALARNPTSSDDKTKGIDIGTRWLNTSTKLNYYCLDNSEGSADWVDYLGLPVP